MNTALDKNKTELGVLVLAISLKMLANRHGLLDELVKILRKLGCKSFLLQDTKDGATRDVLHLCNSVTITKYNTDLTRLQSLLREFAHESLDLSRGGLEPRRRRSSVRKSGFALSFSVICVCVCCELRVYFFFVMSVDVIERRILSRVVVTCEGVTCVVFKRRRLSCIRNVIDIMT